MNGQILWPEFSADGVFDGGRFVRGGRDDHQSQTSAARHIHKLRGRAAQSHIGQTLAGDVICVPGTVNLAATLAGRSVPKWLLRRVSGILGRYTTRS